MTSIDIITSVRLKLRELNSSMVVGPDILVAVFGSTLKTRERVVGDTGLSSSRDPQCILHSLLLGFLNGKEKVSDPLGGTFSANTAKPRREVLNILL